MTAKYWMDVERLCKAHKKEGLVLGFYVINKTNKAGYTATEVACGWAGAVFEVTRPFGQEW